MISAIASGVLKLLRLAAGPWPLWLRLGAVVVVAGALIMPLLIFREEIAVFANRQTVQAAVVRAGPWGPAILIGLLVLQTIVAPVPGHMLGMAAGYLYGPWFGLLYVWLGTVLGSSLAMSLARIAGRPLVERLVSPQVLGKLDRFARGRGLPFFFLVFLIPGLPDDMLCFVAGLTPLPLSALIIVAAAARVPGLSVAVWIGTSAEQLGWQGWLALAGVSLLGLILMWRYGEALQKRLMHWVEKWQG